MKKCIFLIPVMFLLNACVRNVAPVTEQQKRDIEYALLKELFDPKGVALSPLKGGEVKKTDAKDCIDRFVGEMPSHGFTRHLIRGVQPPVPVTPMQITHSVNFQGEDLATWIMDIRKNAGGTLHNIDLRIHFGLYTDKYVLDHQLPDSLKNRISVFIVPYRTGTITVKTDSLDLGNVFGDKVYNLGGLQP